MLHCLPIHWPSHLLAEWFLSSNVCHQFWKLLCFLSFPGIIIILVLLEWILPFCYVFLSLLSPFLLLSGKYFWLCLSNIHCNFYVCDHILIIWLIVFILKEFFFSILCLFPLFHVPESRNYKFSSVLWEFCFLSALYFFPI